jgi:hypothetical protein
VASWWLSPVSSTNKTDDHNITEILFKVVLNTRLCTQFSGNSQSELMNIDGKACNNIPEAVNKLALSAHLGHSCETG